VQLVADLGEGPQAHVSLQTFGQMFGVFLAITNCNKKLAVDE